MNLQKKLIPSVISGIISAIAFYHPHLGAIIFFSLSPLFYSLITNKYMSFRIIFSFSFTFYMLSDIWLLNIGENYFNNKLKGYLCSALLLVLVSFILSIMMSIPFILFRYSRKNHFLDIILISVLFIFGEWIHGAFTTFGFPWNRLCNIVINNLHFIQTASLFGGLWISFLILTINGLISIFFILLKTKKIQSFFAILIAASIYFSNCIAGEFLMSENRKSEERNVIMIQGNYVKKEKFTTNQNVILNRFISLASENLTDHTELIILPETAISSDFYNEGEYRNTITEFCKTKNITLLFGVSHKTNGKKYNSCVAVFPDGSVSEIYYKQVLVPLGEYNPYSMLKMFRFINEEFSCGTKTVIINSNSGKIGCIICFESSFPSIVSGNTVLGAEVLAVLTNDSWLGKYIPLNQHYSHSVMRAVENKKYILNCSNTGITAIITPNGKTVSAISSNQEGVLIGKYYLNNQKTLYSKTGDIIILPSCLIIFFLSLKFLFVSLRVLWKNFLHNRNF